MDGSTVPHRTHLRQVACAEVAGALQVTSAILNGVVRSITNGMDLEVLQRDLCRLEAVVGRLVGIRDQVWMHQFEAQLAREHLPANPATDRGCDRNAG